MKSFCLLVVLLAVATPLISGELRAEDYDENGEITGYHFHTYFHQLDPINRQEAIDFRTSVNSAVQEGKINGCTVGRLHQRPVGPHPIGMFQMCCNSTALRSATSWFMKNVNPNLSVLLHPLTSEEEKDHLERGMWMGSTMPLVENGLREHLDDVEVCGPYNAEIARTIA